MTKSEKPTCCNLKCWAGRRKRSLSYDPNAFRDVMNASPETLELCKRFPYHYCVYLYIPANEVDDEMYPFLRDECKEIVMHSKMDENVRKSLLQSPEVQGSQDDKRLKAISAQTGCGVRIGKLNGQNSIIKGLPRRRLTIAGPSYINISRALRLMEEYFPRLMRFAYYPYNLPRECESLKSGCASTFEHHQIHAPPRFHGTMTLTPHYNDHSSWRKYYQPK